MKYKPHPGFENLAIEYFSHRYIQANVRNRRPLPVTGMYELELGDTLHTFIDSRYKLWLDYSYNYITVSTRTLGLNTGCDNSMLLPSTTYLAS